MMDENNTINTTIDSLEYNPHIVLLGSIITIFLAIFCLVAISVNLIILISIFWIRGPMTPILKISLSLAAADAVASMLFCLGLFGESRVEIFKLIGLLITVVHLLALSLNHYLGILKPLHYNSIMTKSKVTMLICFLWLCPIFILGTIFTVESNNMIWSDMFDSQENSTSIEFMQNFRFRFSYCCLFFIPMVLMGFCYAHILYIVKRQQNVWKKMSRVGSTRQRGRIVQTANTNRKYNEQRQLEGNLRAIYTTLLILGSCFFGWMPALLSFSLMCQTGCLFEGKMLDTLNRDYLHVIVPLRTIENFLIITKMMANAVIYSIRMREIKEAINQMNNAIKRLLCRSQTNNLNYRLACQKSPVQNNGSSMQIRITSFRTNNGRCSQNENNTLL